MLTMIIGGAGSGKSAFAEAFCCGLTGPRVYLATMRPADAESLARVKKHRRARHGLGFETVECPENLALAVLPANANVLLEDLSNLLANELFGATGGGSERAWSGLTSLRERCGHLTVVTNDIFSGGDDYEDGTLEYMRQLAALNRALAASADLVVEVVCGLPNILKGEMP